MQKITSALFMHSLFPHFPHPSIVGILNATPDSFFDGGKYTTLDAVLYRVETMIQEGADIIDIGGESTRPGAKPITLEEERERVLPLVSAIRERFSLPLSIDTSKPILAQEALSLGASLINDVTGGRNPGMWEVITQFRVPYVVMHMQGTPETMQTAPHYSNVVEEVTAFFQAQLSHARTLGLEDFLILDPGIGFGKSLEDNLALLRGLSSFHALGRPLFIGTSCKSFIGALTGAPLEDRLPGSLASALFSFAQGVQFLRVHDVASTKQALTLYSSLLSL